jgi:hypothetical protein
MNKKKASLIPLLYYFFLPDLVFPQLYLKI